LKESADAAPDVQAVQMYYLKLYIAGEEQHSRLARENLKSICDQYLKDRCRVDEVDVLTEFASALESRIFATPALVLEKPEPRVMIVGTLGDRDKVLQALRLRR
jgi:circadian clock protein KaiB